MHICDKTYLALSLLVEASRESQILSRENFSMMGNLRWFHEFCTIKMSTSRMAGHTSAIARIAKEFKSTLIVFKNMSLLDIFKKQTEQQDNLIYYSTFNSVRNQIVGRNINIEAVIVDTSFWVSKKCIDELYDVCLPIMNYDEKFFIFIQ